MMALHTSPSAPSLLDSVSTAWPWLNSPLERPSASSKQRDAYWMQRAIQLAQLGWAHTAPNPMVGCIIVSADNRILGEGWHQRYGQAHAEVMALAAAHNTVEGVKPSLPLSLQGCTAYVTLEPCSHHGKTPPCVSALIGSGITRVVIGTLDSNPSVAGKGRDALQKAGISTEVGILEEACFALNRPFFSRFANQRPYVAVKLATTLDGRLATRSGDSQWISSEASRHWVHHMRANATTLLTTANTVLADNPSLTVRHPLWQKQSTVVILDTHARLSKAITQATHTLFQQDYPQTVFWLTGAHTHSCLEPIQHSLPKHVRWFSIPTELTTKGQPCLALHKVMNLLHQHEQQSVWVEAGGTLATQLLEAQLVDDVYLIQSTQLVGDRYAPHWLGELSGALTHRVSEAMRPLSFVHSQPFGTDAILHLRPHHNPLRIPKLQSAGSLDFRSDPFLKEIPCTT